MVVTCKFCQEIESLYVGEVSAAAANSKLQLRVD